MLTPPVNFAGSISPMMSANLVPGLKPFGITLITMPPSDFDIFGIVIR